MPRVRAYVAATCAASFLASAAVIAAGPSPSSQQLIAVGLFCVLGILTQVFGYGLPKSATGAVSFFPFIAAAVISPTYASVASVCLAVVVGELLIRRALLKACFNVAQHCLALSLGIVTYVALGGQSILEAEPMMILPYVALFAVFLTVNTFAVSGAVAITSGRSVFEVWIQNTKGTIAYDILSVPFVYLFARVYLIAGPVGPVLLGIPLLGVRELYRTNFQLQRVNQELLQLMVAAIEARDPYTSGHSRRVAHAAKLIARAAGLGARQVERIGIAALLHDVGKIHEVYAPILRKEGRLTDEERRIMETHPIKSAELVENVSQLRDVVEPIRHHHENWDGSGYPDRLAGSQIPLAARIIMIADTIDAMTTDRPYRRALSSEEVAAELRTHRGRQFDPAICDIVLNSAVWDALFSDRLGRATPQLFRMRSPTTLKTLNAYRSAVSRAARS